MKFIEFNIGKGIASLNTRNLQTEIKTIEWFKENQQEEIC